MVGINRVILFENLIAKPELNIHRMTRQWLNLT